MTTSNSSSTAEAPWQSIARRKQAARLQALHEPASISIRIPTDLLPNDPPTPSHGAQPVHHIPAQLLCPTDQEITNLPLPALLHRLRTGSLTANAVCSAYIRRASLAHQLTNCLTEPLFSRALTQATNLDSRFRASNGQTVGPLHGLPVSVKDGFHISGVDSSLGLAALCFKPAAADAPLVTLLESLGAVIIAKTNIPQTLSSLDSVNNVFGRTYNPFNRLLTAGGSSGGEGVLVALRGSAVGFGTDIGGSIRVPAMCNGIVGFKPSVGRLPYGGQQGTGIGGMSRASVQAVAGPIARCMDDVELVMREMVPRAALYGEDCIPVPASVGLSGNSARQGARHHHHNHRGGRVLRGSGPHGEFVIGVLRTDGNCQLLPPIANVIDEVAAALRAASQRYNLKIVDLPTPPAWTKSQSVMSKLMGVDGGGTMSGFITSTEEPLVPWISTRFKHGGKPQPLARVAEIQAQRTQLEKEMARNIWTSNGAGDNVMRTRAVDALICPLAAHPVPEIEKYNAVGYTSSWVLFDYPAGAVPVRDVKESDLELGKPLDANLKVLSSWDEKNRELWDEDKMDRRVYLGSKLSVQCVTWRLEDEKLLGVMRLVEDAVRGKGGRFKQRVAKI